MDIAIASLTVEDRRKLEYIQQQTNRDRLHPNAIQSLNTLSEPLVTTNAVSGIRQECQFLMDVAEQAFHIFDLELTHFQRMAYLIEKYADFPMDYADASLVVLAEHLNHGRILTADRRDFSVYRWNDVNPFENLLFTP